MKLYIYIYISLTDIAKRHVKDFIGQGKSEYIKMRDTLLFSFFLYLCAPEELAEVSAG